MSCNINFFLYDYFHFLTLSGSVYTCDTLDNLLERVDSFDYNKSCYIVTIAACSMNPRRQNAAHQPSILPIPATPPPPVTVYT